MTLASRFAFSGIIFKETKMSDRNDKEKLVEDYSYATEAINQILVAANCPNRFRQYIDCLVGVANGNIEFEASDPMVAKRARGRLDGANKHANKEWAKDKRTELLKWQDKGNLKLFEHEVRDYDKSTRTRPPSKYRLHLLRYAEQVITKAQRNDNLWRVNRSKAIEVEAEHLVNEVLGRQVSTPKNKKYIDPPSEVKIKIKSAKTNLEEAVKILKKYDFSLIREDEQLVETIEKLIRAIRDRGFIDDILDTKIFHGIEREPKP
jgi:hypothetical protein